MFHDSKENINKWLTHVHAPNACLILFMMYNVIKTNQKCKHCQNNMKLRFTRGRPEWYCGKQRNNKRCQGIKSVFYGSEFFRGNWVKFTRLAKFVSFLYNRNHYATKKACYEAIGIAKNTADRYEYRIFELYRVVRELDIIKLGYGGSTIEFDGAYYRPKWNYIKNGGILT